MINIHNIHFFHSTAIDLMCNLTILDREQMTMYTNKIAHYGRCYMDLLRGLYSLLESMFE